MSGKWVSTSEQARRGFGKQEGRGREEGRGEGGGGGERREGVDKYDVFSRLNVIMVHVDTSRCQVLNELNVLFSVLLV